MTIASGRDARRRSAPRGHTPPLHGHCCRHGVGPSHPSPRTPKHRPPLVGPAGPLRSLRSLRPPRLPRVGGLRSSARHLGQRGGRQQRPFHFGRGRTPPGTPVHRARLLKPPAGGHRRRGGPPSPPPARRVASASACGLSRRHPAPCRSFASLSRLSARFAGCGSRATAVPPNAPRTLGEGGSWSLPPPTPLHCRLILRRAEPYSHKL